MKIKPIIDVVKHLRFFVWGSVGFIVDEFVYNSVKDSVRDSVRESVGNTVDDSVRRLIYGELNKNED